MPHLVLECSRNIDKRCELDSLLTKLHQQAGDSELYQLRKITDGIILPVY